MCSCSKGWKGFFLEKRCLKIGDKGYIETKHKIDQSSRDNKLTCRSALKNYLIG